MPDPNYIIIALLFFCLLTLMVIVNRLGCINAALRSRSDSGQASATSDGRSRGTSSGAFVKFMAERPELAELSKSEQFAAFRKWRKDQGLNWESR